MTIHKRVLAIALAVAAGMAVACDGPVPMLEARGEVLLGEPPEVAASGLEPGAPYSLEAEMIDTVGRVWRAEAPFYADAAGRIELARDVPSDGSYRAPDPFALLSAMTMPEPPAEDWQAPEPRGFNEIVFTLSRDRSAVASAETRQWIFPPHIARVPIDDGALVAELFHPAEATDLPGVLLLGGSGGGMDWARRSAALLATHGLAAMALAYFNAEGLPSHLVEIPVETVETALDVLAARLEVDPRRLALVGYSKGAELALLVASRRSDVGSVAAFAPGSAVFQGFRPPDYPVLSSWSAGGVGLPFVPNAYDQHFFATFDGMYLWYRTLARHEAFAAAAIPVEKIAGDILLLSGVDDTIWPATFMAEQIVARLRVEGFEHEVRHLAFPEAGHGIAAPPGEPMTSVAERLGGTPAGNARARTAGWRALVEHLTRRE